MAEFYWLFSLVGFVLTLITNPKHNDSVTIGFIGHIGFIIMGVGFGLALTL